jgi:hypothetical protein
MTAFTEVLIMPLATTCSGCSQQVLAGPDGRMPPWCPRCGADLKAHPQSTAAAKPDLTLCPSCSQRIEIADGRLPPWCRYCGASTQPTAPAPINAEVPLRPAASPESAPQKHAASAAAATPATGEHAYFHACIPKYATDQHQMFRVYVTPTDLLVFSLGVGPANISELFARSHSMSATGLGKRWGAMAIEAVTGLPLTTGADTSAKLAKLRQGHLRERVDELDGTDEAMLRANAEAGYRAFVVGPDDCEWMTLGGPSLWYRCLCLRHEAVWTFRHRTQGRWKLVLPGVSDASRAAKWLPPLFPSTLRVT